MKFSCTLEQPENAVLELKLGDPYLLKKSVYTSLSKVLISWIIPLITSEW